MMLMICFLLPRAAALGLLHLITTKVFLHAAAEGHPAGGVDRGQVRPSVHQTQQYKQDIAGGYNPYSLNGKRIAFYKAVSSKVLYNRFPFTHSGVNHARQQPTHQDQLGLGGVLLWDTSTLS